MLRDLFCTLKVFLNLTKIKTWIYSFSLFDIEFSLYVHLINAFTKTILVVDNTNEIIRISRNFRLNKLIEFNYFHVFHLKEDFDITKLIIHKLKFNHKSFWFKKVISMFVVVAIVAIEIKQSITFLSKITNFQIVKYVTTFVLDLKKFFLFFEKQKIFSNILKIIIMSNDVIIHRFIETIFFANIIKKYSLLWKNIEFVKLSKKNWMRISLKSNWKKKIFDKVKVYSLNARDKKLINKIFDELHVQRRLFWTNTFISFNYSIFCVWKIVNDERKNKIVIDIKKLNVITQLNVYFLSLQTNIITIIKDCFYISIINTFVFFYQWRVHLNDRYKFIVITHKKQKSFNVTIMSYKNSSTYIQKQINRLLRKFRRFVRAYVNDIIIFFKIVAKHVIHLRAIFDIVRENNIFIKFNKTFLKYFFVQLLN